MRGYKNQDALFECDCRAKLLFQHLFDFVWGFFFKIDLLANIFFEDPWGNFGININGLIIMIDPMQSFLSSNYFAFSE